MTKKPRIVPPVYFFLTLLVMTALHWKFPGGDILPEPFRYFGVPLMVLGLMSTLWGAGLFKKAGTPIRPLEPSTALVTSGIYRVTRNPMYLGMTLVLLGVAVRWGTLAPFIPIPLFVFWIQYGFIRREEAMLEEIFGESYRVYKSRVRRWI